CRSDRGGRIPPTQSLRWAGCSAVAASSQRVLLRLRWLPAVASSLAQHRRFAIGRLPLRPLTQGGQRCTGCLPHTPSTVVHLKCYGPNRLLGLRLVWRTW